VGVGAALAGLALLTLEPRAGARFGVGELLLLGCALDEALTFTQASDLAERAARAMLAELLEWQLAFRQRNLEIPG
jgi:hypothetical protein